MGGNRERRLIKRERENRKRRGREKMNARRGREEKEISQLESHGIGLHNYSPLIAFIWTKKSKIFVCFLTSANKIDPLNKYFCMHNPIQDKTLKHFILVGSFSLPLSAQNLTWLHSFKKMSIKIFAIVTFLYILEYI